MLSLKFRWGEWGHGWITVVLFHELCLRSCLELWDHMSCDAIKLHVVVGPVSRALQERGALLKKWIQSGENLAACENLVTAERSSQVAGRRVKKLIAVKDTGNAPYNFSKCLS